MIPGGPETVDDFEHQAKNEAARAKPKPDAAYAPIYCALYPGLATLCRQHGYALAVHGSLQRDFDLICVPWVEQPSPPAAVVKDITEQYVIRTIGEPDTTLHGRQRWTISIGFGECAIDLSFMPVAIDAAMDKSFDPDTGACNAHGILSCDMCRAADGEA